MFTELEYMRSGSYRPSYIRDNVSWKNRKGVVRSEREDSTGEKFKS
jgi:hypothetical protein